MFGWFRKKEAEPLVFPDSRAAFDYACEKLPNRLLLEAVIPALVEERVRNGSEGERCYRVRLAGPDGGMETVACTLVEATDWPEPGDLAGYRVVMVRDDLPPEMALLGYLAFVFDPVYVPGKGWRTTKNLTPKNIKPTVRF
jgi:hypothetical protein